MIEDLFGITTSAYFTVAGAIVVVGSLVAGLLSKLDPEGIDADGFGTVVFAIILLSAFWPITIAMAALLSFMLVFVGIGRFLTGLVLKKIRW